jgi:hypothetical protein
VAVLAPHTVLDDSAKNDHPESIEEFRDVLCVSDLTQSIQKINDLAWAVRDALHRASISAPAGVVIDVAEALGPTGADTDDYFGRVVGLRLIVREIP